MHTEIVACLASQHIAELHADADAERHRRARDHRVGPRPTLRNHIGWLLLRCGNRLAPPQRRVATSRHRSATMGA